MKPYIWALMACFIWGCVPIFEKMGLSKVPVFTGLFFRSLGVILGLALLVVLKHNAIKEALPNISHNWMYLVLSGFFASIVAQIFFYSALKGGEASKVVPVAGSFPLVSFILGLIFLGEKLTIAKFSGASLIVLGLILIR